MIVFQIIMIFHYIYRHISDHYDLSHLKLQSNLINKQYQVNLSENK